MVFGRVGKTKSSKVRPDDAVDASSTPNAESWKESGDNVTFSILVGVGLEVTCKFPYDDPQSTNLRRASARVAEDTRDRSAASPDVKTGSFAVTGSCEANPKFSLVTKFRHIIRRSKDKRSTIVQIHPST